MFTFLCFRALSGMRLATKICEYIFAQTLISGILLHAGFSAAADLLVMAASSTTDVMKECAEAYALQSTDKVRFNFASSGTLARQISSGAPADLFISANIKWMDFLEEKGKIKSTSRRCLFGNRMVLIVNNASPLKEIAASELNLPRLIKGRAACGSMESVPCGMYARQIFDKYQWSEPLKDKLVFGSNVRQVLFFVERNEVDAGVVYLTDAKVSKAVRVISTFPSECHDPIIYPAALCTASSNSARAQKFLDFLTGSEAGDIFKKFGFTLPQTLKPILQ